MVIPFRQTGCPVCRFLTFSSFFHCNVSAFVIPWAQISHNPHILHLDLRNPIRRCIGIVLSAIQQFFTDLWDSLTQTMSNPDMAAQLVQPISGLLQLLTPLLALFILIRCGRSLLRGKIEEEVWGYLVTADQTAYPLPHWENLIGRSSRCDVVLNFPTVSRSHAALIRDNAGQWQLHPLNAKNGVLLNGAPITEPEPVQDGDLFDMGGLVLAFLPANEEELHAQAQRRTKPGRFISPGVTLFLLTLFQATLCFKLLLSYQGKADAPPILPCFGVLAGSMWFLYLLYRILKRRGFEIETIAFFLTTLCLTITANGIPKSLVKQTVCVVLGLVVFFSMSLMLRNLELAKWFRWPAAAFSMALLAFNVLFGVRLFGAKNWVSIGPIQFQPSELVKIAFILVGAATLDRMFAKRNLIFTLIFSAFCVGCLGLMSDFGTALIFFVAFLAIAFLRSGDLASVLLMTAAAFFGGYIILKFKTYIAARFLIYRHVWTDPANYGFQQTRTMSALASGGLFGRGVGNGWLKNVGAANTDLVFGVIAEEMGLILAVCCVIAILLLALFAVKEAATARSSFYVIAACSTAMIFVVQVMLNVFGSTDLLPLTGVTFPFVSCGGSSMISCWALLAYIKASDTRQNSALAVKLPKRVRRRRGEELPPEPPQESVPPADTADPIIPQDGPLYTDADDWQRYFKWEDDDE